MRGRLREAGRKARKDFFFEKKKQKTFWVFPDLGRALVGRSGGAVAAASGV